MRALVGVSCSMVKGAPGTISPRFIRAIYVGSKIMPWESCPARFAPTRCSTMVWASSAEAPAARNNATPVWCNCSGVKVGMSLSSWASSARLHVQPALALVLFPGYFDFLMRVVQLLRKEGGVRLFGRIIGIAVWMTLLQIRFPLSGHLRHRSAKRQVKQSITTRQLSTVGKAMAGRGRFLKRRRGVKGVVPCALVRLKVRLPGGGRGASRPVLDEEIIQMRPP